jgi:hypothetical protein
MRRYQILRASPYGIVSNAREADMRQSAGLCLPLMYHLIGNHRTADHPRQVCSDIRGQQTLRGHSAFEATTMLAAHG